MNVIVNCLTLVLFCYLMYVQVVNLVKYKNTNGVLTVRLMNLGIGICLTTHTLRIWVLGFDEGVFFLCIAAVLFLIQYRGFKSIISKIK